MTEVRRHNRKTASGKTTSVRQHERNTGGSGGTDLGREREVPEQPRGGAYVGDMHEPASPDAYEYWADDDAQPEGDWWAEDEDAERYRRRTEQIEAAPDATELLRVEALDRNTAAADAAAQRLIAERLSEEEADPMDAAGRRNVAADRAVSEAKAEVRRTRGSNPLLPPSDAEAAARRHLKAAWQEQDAAQSERAEIFEQQMQAAAARRGVPAYESPAQRLLRRFRESRGHG